MEIVEFNPKRPFCRDTPDDAGLGESVESVGQLRNLDSRQQLWSERQVAIAVQLPLASSLVKCQTTRIRALNTAMTSTAMREREQALARLEQTTSARIAHYNQILDSALATHKAVVSDWSAAVDQLKASFVV